MFYRLITALYHHFFRRIPSERSATVLPVLIPLIVLTLVGTGAYIVLEGWQPLDALYATIITITTVGYGDLTPVTRGGRLFSIFFTLSAIGLASYAISSLAATVIERQASKSKQRIRRRRMQQIEDLKDHLIICGATVVGHRVGSELMRRGRRFVLIELDEARLREALYWMNPEYIERRRQQFSRMVVADFEDMDNRPIADLANDLGVLYVLGDPTDENMLLQAGIGRARGLIPAMDDDRDNIAIILSARDMMGKLNNERLRIVARVSEQDNIRRTYLAGADKITAPNMVGGLQIVDHMLSPTVGEMWDQMLFNAQHTMRFVEWRLVHHPKWIGRTIGELRQEEQLLTLVIHRDGNYVYTPTGDERLESADILITLQAAQ
jgi:voltage-gated potassium channel